MEIEIDLTKAVIDVFRFGEDDVYMCNTDLYCFSHPFYYRSKDEVTGYLYKDYETAFVLFEIINN